MPEAVITGGARTAIGRLLGSLKDLAATDLGGVVIKAALERSGMAGGDVQYVIMGQVLQAGAGQITARQAAVAAGIPMTVPSITINKVCLSGLDAIALAAQLIRAGEFDIVIAGGMESMTKAPHLLPGARAGHKYGAMELLDAMALDGLTDPFEHTPMGELTDAHNKRLGIGRAEQDDFAALSHQRAAAAIKDGLLNDEIVAVPVPQRRGDPVLFDTDEGVRGETTAQALARLRPAFGADGTITAGSASQISDGACAVVVMSAAAAAARGAPVSPTTRACPASGASAAATWRNSGAEFSTSEISRASARGSPALAFPIASRARSPAFTPGSRAGQPRSPGTRSSSALPCPPPPHRAAAPSPPPRRRSS